MPDYAPDSDLPRTSAPAHSGRPIVRRRPGGRALVLCPAGHLYLSLAEGDWAGSRIEARCSDPDFTITCEGALAGQPTNEALC